MLRRLTPREWLSASVCFAIVVCAAVFVLWLAGLSILTLLR